MVFHFAFQYGFEQRAKDLIQDILNILCILDVIILKDLFGNLPISVNVNEKVSQSLTKF